MPAIVIECVVKAEGPPLTVSPIVPLLAVVGPTEPPETVMRCGAAPGHSVNEAGDKVTAVGLSLYVAVTVVVPIQPVDAVPDTV
jgi:hypothetical protein